MMHRNKRIAFMAAGVTVAFAGVAAATNSWAANSGNEESSTNGNFSLGTDTAGTSLQPIQVIGVSPLQGSGVDKDKFPANVQTANGKDLGDSHSTNLPNFLNDRMGSVFLNESQDNPLQPNLTFRGYTISPLLGKPQGMAVYQDGVRINEPFGDTVNFALVPQSAISSVQLTPGSDPVYGRNALGGALSIQTKSGLTDPGTEFQTYFGSFDRRFYQGQTGGTAGQFDYFITASYFTEDGWRDFSPSRDGRVFGKLGWHNTDSRLALSLTRANTDLIGNGGTPVQLLDQHRSAIFTRPDQTQNDLTLVNLQGDHDFTDNINVSGNVYYRDSDDNTRNGDDSDFAPCPDDNAFVCAGVEDDDDGGGGNDDDATFVLDANGNRIQATPDRLGGTNNTTATDQDSYGGSLQVTLTNDIAGTENHLVIGAAYDEADIDYTARTELAALDETRMAVGSGVFDGSSFVDAGINTRSYGLYFTDTWTPIDPLSLTFSGRYNRNEVKIRDRRGSALNGDHTFDHFNPAVGATYRFIPKRLSAYARYSVANRFPVASELTCADPESPCRLPNDFLADPPLKQVVSKSQEAGLRGNVLSVNYTLALFRSVNQDDIQFISSGQLQNTGYFRNVGETRRQGIELTLNGTIQRLDWFLNYTFLDAEFRDPFVASNPNNPAADDNGEVQVEPGDRLPNTPRNLFKLGGNYHITDNLDLGGSLLYRSHAFFAGDPSNDSAPVSGYAVVNLRTNYQVSENVSFFARLNNVFDHDYSTFGTFGEADEVLGDDYDNPRFLSPGPPRAVFVGTRVRF